MLIVHRLLLLELEMDRPDHGGSGMDRRHYGSGGGDLFSEIHMSEIKKFEELLAVAEEDKDRVKEMNSQLQSKVEDSIQRISCKSGGSPQRCMFRLCH